MSSSNLALLTHPARAIAAKRNKTRNQIPQILFDDDARRDFLTGFHKRKLAKAEAARAKAKEREHQERLELRREKRRMLREKALENAQSVERACGGTAFDDADGSDPEDGEWSGVARDEEYEDEETLATVTVVEDFDPTSITHPSPSAPSSPPQSAAPANPPHLPAPKKARTAKPKQKKIAYQTKDERKRERIKQRARRNEKAELAGGKSARRRPKKKGLKG